MSAGGGKAVERFNCTNGGAQFCNGCYTMTPDSDGEYVRHEDYAKLEQQRAALVEALTRLHEACDDSDGACYGTLSTSFVRDICADALRAAGVVLS